MAKGSKSLQALMELPEEEFDDEGDDFEVELDDMDLEEDPGLSGEQMSLAEEIGWDDEKALKVKAFIESCK